MNQFTLLVIMLVIFTYYGGSNVPKILKDNKELLLGVVGGLVLCSFLGMRLEGVGNFAPGQEGIPDCTDYINNTCEYIPTGAGGTNLKTIEQDHPLPWSAEDIQGLLNNDPQIIQPLSQEDRNTILTLCEEYPRLVQFQDNICDYSMPPRAFRIDPSVGGH